MNKSYVFSALLLAGSILLAPLTVSADEGMFLFNNPPKKPLQEKYHYNLSDTWLNQVMVSAVRFNNGGSGSFISPEGLVLTNHHVASDALNDLSTGGRNLFAEGFLAKTRSQELKVPNLELNCLYSIEDVTEQIKAAVKPGMSDAQAQAARNAAKARLEAQSLKETGLRSDVVTLYHGGLYHLYRYKKYTDIRLVWAPEDAVAGFGGDVDNFEYPRQSVDVTFFRVYENGRPVQPKHYLPFNAKGAGVDDLIFVAGHPGSTSRQMTVDDLRFERDRALPLRLGFLKTMEAAMLQYAERGAQERLQAENYISRYANSRKVLTDMFCGLVDEQVMQEIANREKSLRSGANSQQPWEAIANIRAQQPKESESYSFIERGMGVSCKYFAIAQSLVRLPEELNKKSGQRLREYRDSNLDSLKEQLFSSEPFYPEVEKARLQASLTFMAERLGAENPDTQLLLQGKTPAQRAEELVNGCSLDKVSERQRLFKGGAKAIEASQDSFIALARQIDARSRQLRKLEEEQIDEPILKAYQSIAEERFRLQGLSQPPDATFTLRLSYGVVKPYQEKGQVLDWQTTVSDLYRVNEQKHNLAPFDLPDSWLKAEKQVDKNSQIVFVSTADITGGNSGSPVIAEDGSLVGVAFDSNRYGNVNDYLYSEVQGRCLSVGVPVIVTALRDVYGADYLLKELFPDHK